MSLRKKCLRVLFEMCGASFLVAYRTREGFSTNLHERGPLVGGWIDGGGLLLDGTHWYHCPHCLAPPGTNSSPFGYPSLQPSTRMRTIYCSCAFTCSIAIRASWKRCI